MVPVAAATMLFRASRATQIVAEVEIDQSLKYGQLSPL